MENSSKPTLTPPATVDNVLPPPVVNRDTCRPITYQDVFPKSRWVENERYFGVLPDNVQNLLCQLKEQEAYVKLAQEMTEQMEQMEAVDESSMTDQQKRLHKMRQRLKRKLAEKNSS